MTIKIIFNKCTYAMLLLVGLSAIISCQPNDFSAGNGLTEPSIDGSFTITPVEGATNKYLLQPTNKSFVSSKWKIGGDDAYIGSKQETIFIPDAGTYTINHTAIGRGGETSSTSQEVIVETSDPVAGNIVLGGKFADAEDHAKWTVLPISATGAAWTFNQGNASVYSSGGYAQQGIYQAIEVIKDKEYSIDMYVSGGAFTDTWFEVYAGKTVPVPGQDYTDNKIMGLNTWDGCAKAPFAGKLSTVGCVKNSKADKVTNVVKFDISGTIYLVIRSGGNSAFPGAGFTVTKVEMRGKSE